MEEAEHGERTAMRSFSLEQTLKSIAEQLSPPPLPGP